MKSKQNSPFLFSEGFKRYHTADYDYKRRFGKKMCRIPLSGGQTCPNRDGTKGIGGCTFCTADGGGEFALDNTMKITSQYAEMAIRMKRKWPEAGCIAYLQTFSNTYCSTERLREMLIELRSIPDVEAIIIATRADCIDAGITSVLAATAKVIPLEIELGLQSIHDSTAQLINRCHTYREFLNGYKQLLSSNIRVCIHLINSLPGETKEMMLETAIEVGKLRPNGVKLHMLHLQKGSVLGAQYEKEPFPLLKRSEYITVVCDQLEHLPPETVVARVTGDSASDTLIAPQWARKKLTIINDIDKELIRRDSWQGRRFVGI